MAKRGRPRKYKTAGELQKRFDKYFKQREKEGQQPTVTGLALSCVLDRQALIECSRHDEFSYTIKRAKLICEKASEVGMLTGNFNVTVCIFNLKNNFGWRARAENLLSGGVKSD